MQRYKRALLAAVNFQRGTTTPPRTRMFSSGGAGGGGAGDWGSGGGSGGGDGFGPAALGTIYLKLIETHPWPTKIATSAALNAVGDLIGQTLFERDKKFDWLRFAKFTFLVRQPYVPEAIQPTPLVHAHLLTCCFCAVGWCTCRTSARSLVRSPERNDPGLWHGLGNWQNDVGSRPLCTLLRSNIHCVTALP